MSDKELLETSVNQLIQNLNKATCRKNLDKTYADFHALLDHPVASIEAQF